MFDKNQFKRSFQLWSEQFPTATSEELESFFDTHIPKDAQLEFKWLKEQSKAWYEWKRENLQRELLRDCEESELC